LAFSGFYLAMLVVLLSLIVRPVGFKFRGKIDNARWRAVWDWCVFTAGFVPALVFGVAVGNLLSGVPFHYEQDMRIVYDGNGLTELLHPFALLCGVVSLSMLVGHGAIYTAIKTEGALYERARKVAVIAPLIALTVFTVVGLWLTVYEGYSITSGADSFGASTPFAKTVLQVKGGWLHNYQAMPLTKAIPVLAYLSGLLTIILARKGRVGTAFISSGLMLASIIGTAGFSLFPFLIPSTTNPDISLTIWDATSSRNTLYQPH
jgi:cytochrome d ubiquinol oxidase subunit II